MLKFHNIIYTILEFSKSRDRQFTLTPTIILTSCRFMKPRNFIFTSNSNCWLFIRLYNSKHHFHVVLFSVFIISKCNYEYLTFSTYRNLRYRKIDESSYETNNNIISRNDVTIIYMFNCDSLKISNQNNKFVCITHIFYYLYYL